ncbi:MAG TPA: DUF3987 domain-containing protein [Nevskiaceae bacterium]|nr:DUF3987 domain-containing protein [Nevskiaceae bacterium]
MRTAMAFMDTGPAESEKSHAPVANANSANSAKPIAFVANRTAPVSTGKPATFDEVCELVSVTKSGKKDGPAWLPADIQPGPRTGARVESVSFLALDIEASCENVTGEGAPVLDEYGDRVHRVTGPEPPSVEAMHAELSLWGRRCCLHTSYSHGAAIRPKGVEHPRYRLVFDLSRSLKPAELKPLGQHVAALLGLSECFDSSALEPARLFYLPRHPSESRRGAFRFWRLEGAPLDVDALLQDARGQQAAERQATEDAKRRGPHSVSVIDAYNAAHTCDEILQAHGYKPAPGKRWLWPGSTTGMAGVRVMPESTPERIYSSHGGDPLNDTRAHDAFDCFLILEHGGNLSAAVRAAADSLGMRGRATAGVTGGGAPPEPFARDIPATPWPAGCLPDGMREAAQAIAEHVQAPEPLAAFAVLGAVAHIAQRQVNANHPKTGAMPCSLFLLTSADSGDRKSTCYNAATKPVIEYEVKARQAHKREAKEVETRAASAKAKDRAAILADAPADPRTIFTDTTVQKVAQAFIDGSRPALSLSTDEGGVLFSGYSLKSETRAASMGNLTRLFDGRGAERDRIGVDGKDPSGFRYNVRLSLFLSAQPVVLVGALTDPVMRGQGLLPRFLYCAPPTIAGGRFEDEASITRHLSDDPRVVAYWRALGRMNEGAVIVDTDGGLTPLTVDIETEAVTEWLSLYNGTEAEQGPDGDYHQLRAFAGRAGELAARVAAVYAAWRSCWANSEGMTPTVTADDMRRAARLVRYSLEEWKRHDESSSLTPTEKDARDLLGWLQRKGWKSFTRVKLGQYAPGALRRNTGRRNAAIDELKHRRWLADSSGTLKLQKTTAPTAVAFSAVSAVSETPQAQTRRPAAPENSKNSENSNSNPAGGFLKNAETTKLDGYSRGEL